jgi:outer membrane protein assembly factor BamA
MQRSNRIIIYFLSVYLLFYSSLQAADVFKNSLDQLPSPKQDETVFQDIIHEFQDKPDFLPVIFYTPETLLSFGVSGIAFFKPGEALSKKNSSSVRVTVVGTTSGQSVINIVPDIHFKGNNYILRGGLTYLIFNDRFFGLGSQTQPDVYEKFASIDAIGTLQFLKKLSASLYAGPVYHFRNVDIASVSDHGLSTNVAGSNGGNVSGLGATINLDTRNDLFEPDRGSLCMLTSTCYDEVFGSNYNFVKSTLDLRHYFPCFGKDVLAVEGIAQWVGGGDVPFQDLPYVGGSNIMRGYYMGRFRGNDMVLATGEYRVPVWGRVSVAGFLGFAELEESVADFHTADIKDSYGFGFRYLIDREKKINLRLDFGFTPDSSGFYGTWLEAF